MNDAILKLQESEKRLEDERVRAEELRIEHTGNLTRTEAKGHDRHFRTVN